LVVQHENGNILRAFFAFCIQPLAFAFSLTLET